MSYAPNSFASIEERLERIEHLLLSNSSTSSLSDTRANCTRHIYGISGLARLLNCSKPTAQRIKDSGKIPFTQIGRKIVFNEKAVLVALDKREVLA
ncbi:DUF3853 family protein [Spirosoma endophyticum]|uniref:DNA binding domain-containing protein, excisionase family n=1 Tax=Spirosoma endophyticum TaxID=662367 RepID=A0A1I2GZ08_9BACT|nr:DUF3853 family protein [Spirosoma endophyticum]SFF22299.1 DNA binding domain-containing protein, excisionase family [Spirosoma endophyticum]